MRQYRKNFRCSDAFVADEGDEYIIRDGRGRTVERWLVEIGSQRKGVASNHFRVLVTEIVPVDHS